MSKKNNYFDPVNSQVSFVDMEKRRLKSWYKNGIVKKYLHKNDKSNKHFSFIDGPITANNPMGVHHAWGRTYKDLWQKYKNMQGYRQRFQNGFDCQGLWVEVEVEKELELKSKKEIEELVPGDKKASIDKFVELCKKRVLKYSKIQTEQTKRLGNFMDWDNSYFTMSDENNYTIWHFLKVCNQKGWIYKGRDSVPWCPRCETAISQHEMLTEDYKDVTHKSIYLELPLVGKENEYLLIWTTTPWTIPANIAVAVDKKIDYVLVEGTTGDKYWLAKERLKAVFGKDYKKVIKTVKGKELVGLKYSAPFDDLPVVKKTASKNPDTFHKIIATDSLIMPITTSEGTGLVHTAVSAGSEDFKLGKKYNLPMIPVIADNADYLPGLGELSGQNAKKHPEIIFDYLTKREQDHGENWIFTIENYKHRYPACWRCKTELVWKVTDEWYISMDIKDPDDKKNRTLREKMIDVTKKIKWLPEFGLDRELDWLSNMHDWLISKPNRYWGLALPIYECTKCGNFEVLGSKEELKERAVEGWKTFDGHTPHKPWIDEVKIKCNKCGEVVNRVLDVGNVWLDAGIIPFSTIKNENKGNPLYLSNSKEWEKWFPADFITESFPGQFKNWFYSLIAMSTVLEDRNPFDTVLGFATLLAEDGKPMHKSSGNSIEFNHAADSIGADVMRWMYMRTNPSENLLFGYKSADETRRQFHLKLWNIYNYFVTFANLAGWSPMKNKSELTTLDKWIQSRLEETIKIVSSSLDKYNAMKASRTIEAFVDDLSLWYIRRSRGRTDSAFFETTHNALVRISQITAPFMPYLSEEIYINLTKENSVHLSEWPKTNEKLIDKMLNDDTHKLREMVQDAHSARKATGIPVRQPLNSLTTVSPNTIDSQKLTEYMLAELNIKNWALKKGNELKSKFDTKLTPALEKEGKAREAIRQLQNERKKLGTDLDQYITVTLPDWPKEYEDEIKSKTLAKSIKKGPLKVEVLN